MAKFDGGIQAGSEVVRHFRLKEYFNYENKFLQILSFVSSSSNNAFDDSEIFLRGYLRVMKYYKTNSEILDHFKLCMEGGTKFRFMCQNPRIPFKDFLGSGQKCTLLMSGTLRPFDLLEAKLGSRFDSKIVVSPDMAKWGKQLKFARCSNVFHLNPEKKIKFTFSTRSNILLFRNVLSFITEVAKTTKEGVLVFVPSYSVLEIYRKTIQSNHQIKSNLSQTKTIFFEEKGDSSQRLFDQYKVDLVVCNN